jgi:hypothetical protein
MGGMRYRKLRIAWSVFFGVGAVSLIVLWISSNGWNDYPILWGFSIEQDKPFFVHLIPGGIGASIMQFHRGDEPDFSGIAATPYWLLASLSAALSFIPWVRWRFSIRTLLVAITLVAVVLGLVVWMGKNSFPSAQ